MTIGRKRIELIWWLMSTALPLYFSWKGLSTVLLVFLLACRSSSLSRVAAAHLNTSTPCLLYGIGRSIHEFKMAKTPRYYPAEDIKPAKAVHKVKQNVSKVVGGRSVAADTSVEWLPVTA